jgi:hypothetical protein
VYFALPTGALTAWYLDTRVPVFIAFLIIGSTSVTILRPGLGKALAVLLLGLLVVRSTVIVVRWTKYDDVISDLSASMAKMPDGAILFAASAAPAPSLADIDLQLWQPPLKHIVSLASINRPIFAPTTYADPITQPLGVTTRYKQLYDLQDRDPIEVHSAAELDDLKARLLQAVATHNPDDGDLFLLLLYPRELPADAVKDADIVAHGSRFALIALKRRE